VTAVDARPTPGGAAAQQRVAFLGPEGTFTAEAAARVAPHADRLPVASIPDVFAAVREGRVDLGVVPIENLIEGSVNATLDELAFGPPGVHVRGEVLVPISMNLLARPGVELADVTALRSHPHALAQCREWVAAHLPGVEQHASTSTAEAAKEVAEEPQGGTTSAALGTRLAAERYGLRVLAADVHDRRGNLTRFAVLGRRMAGPSGADKTSVVVFFGEDRPGLLLRILDELALRGINLTKIESRPTKTTLGEYCILIDCEGHPTEARLSAALRAVHRHVAELRILGAYPRADGIAAVPEPAEADDAYRQAQVWYDDLLARMDRPETD
jgi:prephenate dehydratase